MTATTRQYFPAVEAAYVVLRQASAAVVAAEALRNMLEEDVDRARAQADVAAGLDNDRVYHEALLAGAQAEGALYEADTVLTEALAVEWQAAEALAQAEIDAER